MLCCCRRFDSAGPRRISTFFAAPSFVAVGSSSRNDGFEVFLFAALNPKPLMLRDARAVGHVTAFTVDAAGREYLNQQRKLFEVLPNVCACLGTLYSALTGGVICAWTTGSKPNEWGYVFSTLPQRKCGNIFADTATPCKVFKATSSAWSTSIRSRFVWRVQLGTCCSSATVVL